MKLKFDGEGWGISGSGIHEAGALGATKECGPHTRERVEHQHFARGWVSCCVLGGDGGDLILAQSANSRLASGNPCPPLLQAIVGRNGRKLPDLWVPIRLILEHCWSREKSSCRFHREERRKRKVDSCHGREDLWAGLSEGSGRRAS